MKILLIQGHPDGAGGHLCHALAAAYVEGAASSGHEIKQVAVADAEVGILHNPEDWRSGTAPDYAIDAQQMVLWADHIVMFFPLWMGGMPAALQAWIEQVFRQNFAFEVREGSKGWTKKLTGRSVHIIVTMGMPSIAYSWIFGAPGTKRLRRSILGFAGLKPIRQSLIGSVEGMTDARFQRLADQMRKAGTKGA